MNQSTKIVIWEQDRGWLGYLQDYPDYWTQGDTLDDLKEHLKDLYDDLTSGRITSHPQGRRIGDIVKRIDLIKTIEGFGCVLIRRAANMTGIATQRPVSPNPRHREVNEHLAKRPLIRMLSN